MLPRAWTRPGDAGGAAGEHQHVEKPLQDPTWALPLARCATNGQRRAPESRRAALPSSRWGPRPAPFSGRGMGCPWPRGGRTSRGNGLPRSSSPDLSARRRTARRATRRATVHDRRPDAVRRRPAAGGAPADAGTAAAAVGGTAPATAGTASPSTAGGSGHFLVAAMVNGVPVDVPDRHAAPPTSCCRPPTRRGSACGRRSSASPAGRRPPTATGRPRAGDLARAAHRPAQPARDRRRWSTAAPMPISLLGMSFLGRARGLGSARRPADALLVRALAARPRGSPSRRSGPPAGPCGAAAADPRRSRPRRRRSRAARPAAAPAGRSARASAAAVGARGPGHRPLAAVHVERQADHQPYRLALAGQPSPAARRPAPLRPARASPAASRGAARDRCRRCPMRRLDRSSASSEPLARQQRREGRGVVTQGQGV